MARPTKLTPEREARILETVQQAAVTQEEAALAAGISPRTLYRWKARGRELVGILPTEWRRRTVGELRKMLAELSVAESEIDGTGAGGRVVREDLVRTIQDRAERFVTFFESLDQALLAGELANSEALQSIGRGGTWRQEEDGARVWQPIETVRVYEEPFVEPNGSVTWREVRRVRVQHGPSETALRFILERRYAARYGPKRAAETGTTEDPRAYASRVQRALSEMVASVPTEATG